MNEKKLDSKNLEIIRGGMPTWWLNDDSVTISQTSGCTKCTFNKLPSDSLQDAFLKTTESVSIDLPPVPAACDNLS